MHIPKQHRRAIITHLFNEGTMVVKKDTSFKPHQNIAGDIPNLHVLMIMRSLLAKDYVIETFSWQHHYFTLTSDGISRLRQELDIPETETPNTFKSRPSVGKYAKKSYTKERFNYIGGIGQRSAAN